MAEHTSFFYGTLMAPGVLYRVCYGSAKPLEHQTRQLRIYPALLHGFSRHRVRYADYPGIIPATSSSSSSASPTVLGTYVTGLTPMDVQRLDQFEGSEYERRDVSAQVLRGSVEEVQRLAREGKAEWSGGDDVLRTVDTQVYVYKDRRDLEDREWDFDEFMREKLRFWTLEERPDYADLKYDDQSDGTRGRGASGDITAQLEAEFAETKESPEKGAERARAAV